MPSINYSGKACALQERRLHVHIDDDAETRIRGWQPGIFPFSALGRIGGINSLVLYKERLMLSRGGRKYAPSQK